MLTERRGHILELIVEEYVDSAVPVGSETIVRKHHLGVSPATIRNEMARLEEEGYISHPHTSAGRVPTEKGYRYFVESLMEEEDLPWEQKQTILHQFHQTGQEREEWLHLAAAVLAGAARNMAVVTMPRSPRCRLRHIELVPLHDVTVLLMVVLEEASVRHHVLTLPEPVSHEELSELAHRLTQLYGGLTTVQVRAAAVPLSPLEVQVVRAVVELMLAEDEAATEEAYLEGLRHVLAQPEFASSDKILALLEAVDERNLTRSIPLRRLADVGVRVIIGGEHLALDSPVAAGTGAIWVDALRECSVVVARYGAPGALSGALAVVGPTRMHYPRTISTVRYMSVLMSDLLEGSYSQA
jgi:heat-inducible transcriptional repressor